MSDRPAGLTHVDEAGAARMVDVSAKDVTARTATAAGRVLLSAEVVALLRGEGVPKGDALGVARLAGIMGAKRTPDLIPLCHPIALHGVTVDLEVADDGGRRSPRPPGPRTAPAWRWRRSPRHGGRARPGRHGQGGRPGRDDHRRAGAGEDRRQDRPLDPAVSELPDRRPGAGRHGVRPLRSRRPRGHLRPAARRAAGRARASPSAPVVLVPDEAEQIDAALRAAVADGVDLVVTTGGTGLSPRDVTPEAALRVIEREVPGIAEALRQHHRDRVPTTILSRSVAGRGRPDARGHPARLDRRASATASRCSPRSLAHARRAAARRRPLTGPPVSARGWPAELVEGDVGLRPLQRRDAAGLGRGAAPQRRLALPVGGHRPRRGLGRRAPASRAFLAMRATPGPAGPHGAGRCRSRSPSTGGWPASSRVGGVVRGAMNSRLRRLLGGPGRAPAGASRRPRSRSPSTTPGAGRAAPGGGRPSGRRTRPACGWWTKLGFREEGLHQRYLHIDGAYRDHVSFALTAEELPEPSPGPVATHPGRCVIAPAVAA